MKPCLVCGLLSLMITGVLGLLAIAQEEPKPDATSEAAEFLKAARANAAIFRIQDAKTGEVIERVENPVLRYTEPTRVDAQGTMWIWGRKGRPVASSKGPTPKRSCCWIRTRERFGMADS